MLSQIRERATGWIAYIIVGIIVIPFAFWGVNEYFSGGQEVIVATVNGVEIEQVDYRRALESRRRQMRRLMGENFEPELANRPEFKRGVLDDLISRVLLTHHAKEQDYRIGDEQLARTIRVNPRFQDGGNFSPDAYSGAVRQMGLTEAGFESRLHQQLIFQQIRDGVRHSSFGSPRQERHLLQLLLQKRRFDHTAIKSDRYTNESIVSAAEIQKEYEAGRERYRTPAKLKIEYVELSVDDLASMASVTEEDIRRTYERNRERFATEPVRRASHILIETDQHADEQERQEALKKAHRLLGKLRAGADFEKLAKEHSDDPGSAAKGGDLGRIEPGVMVGPFEDALFSLEETGALTKPVKTRFGYHIIKLTEYESVKVKPLEEVREQVESEERGKQAEALFLDRAEAFRNISYEQPKSLEPVADRLDLAIQRSDWFTRREGTGVATNPTVRETAFGDDVYEEGLNSEAIELDIDTLVVLRKLDTRPSTVKPLEEVRGEIEARMKRRKAEEYVAALGPDLVDQLKAGTAWEALLGEYGLADQRLTRSRGEFQDEAGPAPAVVEAVFRAPSPAKSGYVYEGLGLANGDYALFRLVDVIKGDVAQAPEELENRVRGALSRRRSQDMVEQYIADLREQAEVSIKEEAL
ncbi:MAG: Peptidyl-prolyl cis-trans isomerase D [Gammaproteobacteria bacterium]|nr:Peptidyl-prolyl cis-trans isomerase D [Gammaproteobacteria bacterium]